MFERKVEIYIHDNLCNIVNENDQLEQPFEDISASKLVKAKQDKTVYRPQSFCFHCDLNFDTNIELNKHISETHNYITILKPDDHYLRIETADIDKNCLSESLITEIIVEDKTLINTLQLHYSIQFVLHTEGQLTMFFMNPVILSKKGILCIPPLKERLRMYK